MSFREQASELQTALLQVIRDDMPSPAHAAALAPKFAAVTPLPEHAPLWQAMVDVLVSCGKGFSPVGYVFPQVAAALHLTLSPPRSGAEIAFAAALHELQSMVDATGPDVFISATSLRKPN